MNVYISQIYIQAGVSFPFSHHFQLYLSQELTKRVKPSDLFINKYGEDFSLMFRMSAKAELTVPEIKGPTVYRKDRDVEFSIFLTYDKQENQGPKKYRQALGELLDQIVIVLEGLEIDTAMLRLDAHALIESILTTPRMINAK